MGDAWKHNNTGMFSILTKNFRLDNKTCISFYQDRCLVFESGFICLHKGVCNCGIVFWNWITVATGHILLCFVHWKNNRKLSCFSDWYSFVNGLLGWQTMDKMASTYPHEQMSLLAYKLRKSNLLASRGPSLLHLCFLLLPPSLSILQACERDMQCGLGLCCAVSLWLRGLRMCAPRGLEGDECHPYSHKVGVPHQLTHKHAQTVRLPDEIRCCRGYRSCRRWTGQLQPCITQKTTCWGHKCWLKKLFCFPASGALSGQKAASHLPLPAPLDVHPVRRQQV